MARGSVTKRTLDGGRVRWDVVVDLGDDPVTGKRRQRKKTFATRREAEAGLHAWLADIEKGVVVDRSVQTVGEYLEYWLDTSARHRVRMTTYTSYAQITRDYIVPFLGHVSLQELAPAMLQALYAHLLAGEGERRPLSPRTVRYTHAVMRMALKEALRLGLVARNVADAVSPPKAVRPQVKAWDAPELRHFLDVAGADRYSPLWLLAAHTGMRQGELLGLRWQDIDLSRGIARVVQTVPTHHHGVEFGVPKTASGRRTIALDATCIAALRAHRASQNERRLAMGELWHDYDLVFTSGIGTPLNQGGVYHRFIALVRTSGLPRIPFHGLRHSHATVLMKQGVNPKVVSERLGHADISITLQTYSHVLPQMQQEAAAIFEAAMGDG